MLHIAGGVGVNHSKELKAPVIREDQTWSRHPQPHPSSDCTYRGEELTR